MDIMDIIPETAPKRFTIGTIFSNYVFIVYAYFKNKLYGMERITTEEVMDKLDICQFRF